MMDSFLGPHRALSKERIFFRDILFFCHQKAFLPINSPMDVSGSKDILAISVSGLFFFFPLALWLELLGQFFGLTFLSGVALPK